MNTSTNMGWVGENIYESMNQTKCTYAYSTYLYDCLCIVYSGQTHLNWQTTTSTCLIPCRCSVLRSTLIIATNSASPINIWFSESSSQTWSNTFYQDFSWIHGALVWERVLPGKGLPINQFLSYQPDKDPYLFLPYLQLGFQSTY